MATPGDGGVILPVPARELDPSGRVLAAVPVAPGGAGPDDQAFVLSPEEQRMVLKQRAHAERNAGDPDPDA